MLTKKFELLIFITVSVIILGVYFYNLISTSEEIQISNTTLEQILQINWNDEKSLLKLGFEKGADGHHLLNNDNDEIVYSLSVSPLTNEKDIPANMNKYNNVSYKAEESKIGKLDIRRIWLKEIHVSRRYIVHINNMEIYMREENTENSPYKFEKIIDTLFSNAKISS